MKYLLDTVPTKYPTKHTVKAARNTGNKAINSTNVTDFIKFVMMSDGKNIRSIRPDSSFKNFSSMNLNLNNSAPIIQMTRTDIDAAATESTIINQIYMNLISQIINFFIDIQLFSTLEVISVSSPDSSPRNRCFRSSDNNRMETLVSVHGRSILACKKGSWYILHAPIIVV